MWKLVKSVDSNGGAPSKIIPPLEVYAMARGRGRGETPPRLVGLLKEVIVGSSQAKLAGESGIGVATINRYLKGEGEPSQETLEKPAAYFGVSVGYLRGDIGSLYDGLDLIPHKESIISVSKVISVGEEAVNKYISMVDDSYLTDEMVHEAGI